MNRSRGFTIVELMITISIIALLISAASLLAFGARATGRDAQRISNLLLIGKAIDQSVTLSRGIYPKNAAHAGVNNAMCADELYGTGSTPNPNQLDLSAFGSHEGANPLPKDPLPATTSRAAACTDISQGYMYYSQYGASPTSYAVLQNVAYTLATGLEREHPSDETQLRSPSELNISTPLIPSTIAGRSVYLLNGTYCGNPTYSATTACYPSTP